MSTQPETPADDAERNGRRAAAPGTRTRFGRLPRARRFSSFGYRLPQAIRSRLFGDRLKYGVIIHPDDPDWAAWQATYSAFYDQTQKQSLGAVVNNAGYRILGKVQLDGKQVLEIGPGDIQHLKYWRGKPECFHIADIQQSMLDRSAARLAERGIPYKATLLSRDLLGKLPFADAEFDVLISFYAFEHLYPFSNYLQEMLRVLKPGGFVVGAIPTEGGLAWGFGRFVTSRRWLLRNTKINPDKIICWEHPNYAQDLLIALTQSLTLRRLEYWPWGIPAIDLNLVLSFILQKPAGSDANAATPLGR